MLLYFSIRISKKKLNMKSQHFFLDLRLCVLGFVTELIVKMNKGSLNLGQKLELLLQRFSNIMSFLKGHVGREHYVDLNKVMGPEGVGSDSVNVPYGLVVVPT